jgi:hypothetical protein
MKIFNRTVALCASCAVLLASSAHAQGGIDLLPSTAPTGPVSVIRGQEDTVFVDIRNQGDTPTAGTFDVTAYLSVDDQPTTIEKVGDKGVTVVLAPGETRSLAIPIRVPSLQALGTYQWLVQVDAVNVVAEVDETNNVGVGSSVEVAPTPPDFLVTAGPTGPDLMSLGTSGSVSVTVTNVGLGSSFEAYDITVYLSTDETFDAGDIQVGRVVLQDGVNPDESRTQNITVFVAEEVVEASYHWIAVVDDLGTLPETDEANNAQAGNEIQIILTEPDLTISIQPEGDAAIFQGVSTAVTLEIENQGDGPTDTAFDVAVYLTADLIVGNEDDIRVGDSAILNPVGPGGKLEVTVPVIVSAVQPVGVYNWAAVVDDGGFVVESDETDNGRLGQSFTVIAQPADLVVSTAPEGPGLVIWNSFYTVNLEIQNVGAGTTTGAFQVSVYLSSDETAGNDDDVRIGNLTYTEKMLNDERASLEVQVVIPSQHPIGIYRYSVVVDATSFETEVSDLNNGGVSTATVVVSSDAPDLLILTDPVGPIKVLREGTYIVSADIQNFSGGPLLDDFVVAAVMSTNSVVGDDDDVKVGELAIVSGMGAGEIINAEVVVTVPADLPLDDYQWGLIVDDAGSVIESDESNNANIGLLLTVVPFPPDLVVLGSLEGPGEVSRGRLYTVPVDVRNAGDGSTIADFEVAVYLTSNDLLGDEDDVLVGVTQVSSILEPEGIKEVNVPVIVPESQGPDNTLRWGVIINSDRTILETDFGNNSLVGNPLAFPIVDLPDSLEFGAVLVGDTSTHSLVIRNDGDVQLSFDIELIASGVRSNATEILDLPPGESESVVLTYAPNEVGTLGGQVRISNNLQGVRIIYVGGSAVLANRDRVRLDLNTLVGLQDVLTTRLGVNETTSMEIHVADLPEVSEVTVQMSYDPSALVLAANGWVAGGFASEDGLLQTEIVAPGLLELRIVSQGGNFGPGDGHLGTVTFRTVSGFFEPSGVGETRIETAQLRYRSVDGQETAVSVISFATLSLDLGHWADWDGDGSVGFTDFTRLVRAFNKTSTDAGWSIGAEPHRRMDGNGDGKVDLADFLIFTNFFGQQID